MTKDLRGNNMSAALDFIYNILDVFSGGISPPIKEGRPALVDLMDTPRNREKAQLQRILNRKEEYNDE